MSADDMDGEAGFSEEEQREAAALARALERGHAEQELPDAAFQTAALLRHAQTGSELAPDREDAVLTDLLEHVRAPAAVPDAPPRTLQLVRWLLGVGGLAAAAALVFWWTRPAPDATALPAPSAALLSAQLGRLSGDDEGYADQMGSYRTEVFGALSERYAER